MVAYLEFGGAEIKGSERRGAKLAWAVGPEKEVSSLFMEFSRQEYWNGLPFPPLNCLSTNK